MTKTQQISVVIAARNEAATIASVILRIRKAEPRKAEIIVVDDCSTDSTGRLASRAGALVIRNQRRLGQTASLQKGLSLATGDVIITMDADGEHDPRDIPPMLNKLSSTRPCVVVGRRETLPRLSEKLLTIVFKPFLGVSDIICGFRAIPREILGIADFDRYETWGAVFLLSCAHNGVRIFEMTLRRSSRRSSAQIGGRILGNLKILRCLVIAFTHLLVRRVRPRVSPQRIDDPSGL
jgi:glycosyltransferase involved in cell wall biosynthesis